MKFEFIRTYRKEHKVTRMCEVLEVSTSGYYEWVDWPESARSQENRQTCRGRPLASPGQQAKAIRTVGQYKIRKCHVFLPNLLYA